MCDVPQFHTHRNVVVRSVHLSRFWMQLSLRMKINSFKLKRDANTLYNFINSIVRHHPLEIFTLTASVEFSSPFKSSSTKTLKGKGKKSTEKIYNLGNSVESITALVQFIQRRLCVTIFRLIFLFNASIC